MLAESISASPTIQGGITNPEAGPVALIPMTMAAIIERKGFDACRLQRLHHADPVV